MPPSEELTELAQWLRIPSISGDQRFHADVLRAARWLAEWLRSAGARVRVVSGSAAPLVTALFGTSGPLGVLYGHYDVQPPGPGWCSPPFTPRLVDGQLRARGASDDKGQLFAHLVALRRLTTGGQLPGRVLVVAEGAEEVGSLGFAAALATLPRTRAAAVVVSDTQRAGHRTPAVTVSQRGLVKLAVRVDVGGRPVHPGRYSGALVDPSLVLSEALTSLARAVQTLPGVAPPVEHELFSVPDQRLVAATGGRALAPRPGSRHAWLTTHTSVAVTRMRAGTGEGTAPTDASALVDVRLPPGVPPQPVASVLRKVIRAHRPPATTVDVSVLAAAQGLDRLPPAFVLDAVERACLAGFGRRPAYVRSGGSVPAVAALRAAFGPVPLLWGLGPPDDGAHGPNEYLDVAGFRRAVRAAVTLWSAVVHPNSVSTDETVTLSEHHRPSSRGLR